MDIEAIRTPGLGDTTYVLSHEGVAIVVDPQRDIDRFEAVLDDLGADLCGVLETHLHNDYVSGGRDLAARGGAELVMPAGAAPFFDHRPAFHNEDMDLGPFTVRPIHTPGHTPEHVSYLVLVEGRPQIVFTGGSLLFGSAGRTDLLGWDRAATLAALQYGSLQRLLTLPDHTTVCPTHGAGSFCSATAVSTRSISTIGQERRANPALAYSDEETFRVRQLSDLVPYPNYYSHMAELNLHGVMGPPNLEVHKIGTDDLESMGDEVVVVDGRPVGEFAKAHLPGSISIELRRDFGVWVGWVVEFGAPLALVLDPAQDGGEALRQLARIGFDDVRGIVIDLSDAQDQLESYRAVGPKEFAAAVLDGAQVLDTRAPNEWDTGTIDGTDLIYVPDVASDRLEGLDPARPVWVACASGFRAGITASLLAARGYQPVVLTGAGITEVLSLIPDNG